MGLGGAAEGGTTVMAMIVLGVLGLVVLGLAVVLRWRTGRWKASAMLVTGAVLLVGSIAAAGYFSGDSRERRQAAELRGDVGAALTLDIGADDLAEGFRREECGEDGEHGWVAYGYANVLELAPPAPTETLEGRAAQVESELEALGFATDSGEVQDGRRIRRWVSASRGDESVIVDITDYGSVFVEAESGCLPSP